MKAAARGALPAALFAALVLALFADPLLTRRTFVGRDIVPYNLPLEKAVHDAWARGRVPVWWEEVSGGRPLLPNPNAGVFYPVRPLLAPLALPAAMRLFPILHWILAGWGVLFALRSLCSRGGAWVGAACYVFSGVVLSEVFYTNFLPGAALLPWALWAVARGARRPLGRVVPIAIVFALMFLAGDVFSVFLAVLAGVLWIAFEGKPGERARQLGLGAAGVLAGALLALPQILATALLAPETRRAVVGVTLGEALTFTLSPWRLLELVVPFPFGPTWSMDLSQDWGTRVFRHFFTTVFVAPVAVFGLLAPLGPATRGARAARGLVAACVALAVAGALAPASWAAVPSPVPLRYPEKFMLGATLGLAVLAGLAVDALRRGRRAGWFLGIAGVLAAAALLAAALPGPSGSTAVRMVGGEPALGAAASAALPGALAEAGLLWVATGLAALWLAMDRPALGAAALALLTAVPVAANRRVAQTAAEATVYPPTAFARAIARRDPDGRFRALDESVYRAPSALREATLPGDVGGSEFFRQSWVYYTPSLWRRGLVFNSDLDAGDLSRIESLRRVSALAATQSDGGPFFSSLALRFGMRFRDQEPLAGFRPFGRDALRSWDENPSALPDVRLVRRWVEAEGPVEALAALPRLPEGGLVVESGKTVSGEAREGAMRVLEQSPERLRVETQCPDPTWLFVLRGDWSYRVVSVDGRPTPVFPAQIAFAAVPVPPGVHRVEWRETIPGIEISAWGPVAGLALLAALGLRRAA
ncbi:MAG TPA: hypothetical protein VMN82_16550 [Thermoanaerobaculia bacterium]|nr:hypothetical protein [Thermoanaerobaculia bacterium]